MKVLFLAILLISTVFASDKDIATKIYLSLAMDVSEKKDPIFYLYGHIKYLENNSGIHTTHNCNKADLIILNTLEKLPKECQNKPLFTTKYRTYLKHENIIGAFFWQKGRPNIVFRKSSIEKNNIHLESSFSKYTR